MKVTNLKAEETEHIARTAARIAKDLAFVTDLMPIQGLALDKVLDLVQRSTKGTAQIATAASLLFAYVAEQITPGLPPVMNSEVLGSQVRVSYSVGGQFIGSLIVAIPSGGGEASCMLHSTFTSGALMEINGDIASKYLCQDPAHHGDEVKS